MDRLEVICRAADSLRDQASAGARGLDLLRPLLAAQNLHLVVVPESEPMLGGAVARLWLHVWEQPPLGGIVWLRAGLAPEREAFAVAHELGHLLLHRGEGIPLRPACDEREVDESAGLSDLRVASGRVEEYTPRARREQEASAFAAELLAPRALVRRRFLASTAVDAETLAAAYGISVALARQRLADAVLVARADTEVDPARDGSQTPRAPRVSLAELDASQAMAARAQGPALVVAGPGSGKTKTLVGRVAHLIAERGVPPEHILALTFSNRAAGEMRERLMDTGLPGERIPVMTIHAFAASLLREYAPYVPHAPGEQALQSDFRIIGPADSFLLLEDLLAELSLRHYRSLGNPTRHLGTLLADFSRARDALLTPAGYLALVEAMPLAPDMAPDAQDGGRKGKKAALRPPEGTFTREAIAKARERARAYGVWDRALRRRGLVDFGGLILRAVELLRARPGVLAELRGRYPQVLVDEFQDTNHAAAELLMLLAGDQGTGLWVVGDRQQSIYRWRGASPANLPRLAARYPALDIYTLRVCYRSVPAIVRLGSALAARMSAAQPAIAGASATAADALAAPVVLSAHRAALSTTPPVLRCDAFATRGQERAGLAVVIRRRHAEQSVAYRDQAVLCRTRAQAAGVARMLAQASIPASQQGNFFDREEVKDALALLALAAGPDPRGLLRAPALLAALGCPALSSEGMHALVRAAAGLGQPLPGAFPALVVARGVEAALSAAQRAGVKRLGGAAQALRYAPSLGEGLGRFLLLPGGYAWRLARVADGLEAPVPDVPIAALASQSAARSALEALGELLRLARHFDQRWHGEQGFRERLVRAVRRPVPHGTPQLAAADATEPAPGADVAANAGVVPAPDLVPRDADGAQGPLQVLHAGDTLAVACFLRYLSAVRSVDEEVVLPAPDEDAVQVLTIHASKGLEFPVVYLPALASGQFPAQGRPDDPQPPGFRSDGEAEEHEAEERCLFYVALTRARDSVVLTRAAAYGGRSARPSPLLALLDESADYAAAVPLHTEAELAALPVDDSDEPEEDDDEEGEGDRPPRDLEPRYPPQVPEFTLHELEQYLNCPRQYKYARRYQLLDPAENAVYRFHRFVRRGLRELRDLHHEAPGAAGWDEAERRLRAAWTEEGPAGHAYDAYYWSHAEEILRDEWARVTQATTDEFAARVRLAESNVAMLPGCRVRVTADRVVRPASDMPNVPDVLVRLHTGRPRPDDVKDLALPLLYLAYTQRHAGREPRIQLVYLGRPLDGEPPEALGADGGTGAGAPAEQVVDVTDEARSCVEKFFRPGRKQISRLDKLLRAAAGIAASRFEPRPQSARCAACAFCAVCPADPDESADSTTLALPAHGAHPTEIAAG
ncbi:MAG TPA: UvrD-helicase domain-containing protein [Ktedonobacterales bacterium]